MCRKKKGNPVVETLARIMENLAGRASGPLHMRLLLQPLMASIFAIRSGLNDARTGQPAYFWALFTDPDQRRAMLRNGWKSIRNIFVVAIVLDVVYQLIALHTIYPFEALLVATILALVPYLIIRGPANRILRHFVAPNLPVTTEEHLAAIHAEEGGKH